MTPTSRTLSLLRADGFAVAIVERRIPHCNITVDAFGMFDVLAIREDVPGALGVQTTSGSNHSARVKKLLANPILKTWTAAGNVAEVWSWAKRRVLGRPQAKARSE